MRNLRIAGVALLLTLATSSAAVAQGRTLGARLGASVATLDTDAGSVLDEENRTGLVAGVFYNRSLGLLGYQVEVLYTNRGADFGDGGSLDLTYVQIPALLKVNLPVGMLQPGVFAGVAAALEVDCRVDDSDSCDDIEGAEVNDVDVNGVVGADLKYSLAGVGLWLDGRYYVGMSDIGEFDDVVGDLKNRSWEFSAGLGIPLP
ncbi:MAG: outer membrane beta-barrel protein [Gemmatimonadota bacterium]